MFKPIFTSLILRYLRLFAQVQLKKNAHAIIVGVTGSSGKTSTIEALAMILRPRGRVKTISGANSQTGIPLHILGLSPRDYSILDWIRLLLLAPIRLITDWEHYDYYLIEMGIDGAQEPSNMSYLLKIVCPHVGIVLNASLAHAGGFDSLVKDHDPLRRATKLTLAIATEKMRLATAITREGVAVINLDQPELRQLRKQVSARVLTFGKSPRADLQILPQLHFRYLGATYHLDLPPALLAPHPATIAAALAGAIALGIPPSLALPPLRNYAPPPGRLRMFPGINHSHLIDSSYNASPSPMLESLKVLASSAKGQFKLAVIGDMRELGESTKLAHKNLATWLLKYTDRVILFGSSTRLYTLPILLAHHFPAVHFTHMADLINHLQSTLPAKSWVLFKGSQNTIFLERAVESLLVNHSDVKYLCRRGAYWDKIRASMI